MNVGREDETGKPEDVQHEKPVWGWKSIAAEVGRSESWAKTTAKADGLPVQRVGRDVFAFPSRLHAWLRERPSAPAEGRRTPTLRVVGG